MTPDGLAAITLLCYREVHASADWRGVENTWGCAAETRVGGTPGFGPGGRDHLEAVAHDFSARLPGGACGIAGSFTVPDDLTVFLRYMLDFLRYMLDRATAEDTVRGERDAGYGDEPWTVHTLRHFFASSADAGGVALLEVSRRLGHSAIQITADVPGRLTPDAGGRLRSVTDQVPTGASVAGADHEDHAGPVLTTGAE
ncbi:hypothetical protein [Streptomyces sp. NPDC088766]|uniref:hypothetical protein n=1 Tax=Streptomyces sp. NPDC088766 TaxID=3365893 RepID=UPI0038292813